MKKAQTISPPDQVVYKKYHHSCDWYFRNLTTDEEVKFCQQDETQIKQMQEFEKGKFIVYD